MSGRRSPIRRASIDADTMSAVTADARPERPLAHAVLRAWWPVFGLLLFLFAAATVTHADADLWGHVRFGLDALRSHRLPSVDPYSFTQDTPWLNHEWLSEAQMGLAWIVAGPAGLALLKALLVVAAFALMWGSLRGARTSVRIVALVVAAVGTVHATSSLRPQVWTFLLMAVLGRVLLEDHAKDRRWLPVIFALWANLHGGWIVGLGVLGLWAGLDVIVDRQRLREWIWIVPACVLATLVTPYGWRLWQFVATTVRPDRSIEEWKPLWGTPVFNWMPWVLAVGAAIWAATRRFPRRWSTVGVLAVLAWSSSRVMRVESLFVELAVILIAPVIVARWPARLATLPPVRPKLEPLVAFVMFLAPAAASARLATVALPCLSTTGPWAPDGPAARYLEAAVPGRLVTFFDWGEYAIWHFGPRLRVSMDGRRETVYTDERLVDHDDIRFGRPRGFDLLQAWQPEYVWLPIESRATRDWLAGHGYRIDAETDRSFVAVRADLPRLPRPPAEAPAGFACFPG
jgi:hypothetical protein